MTVSIYFKLFDDESEEIFYETKAPAIQPLVYRTAYDKPLPCGPDHVLWALQVQPTVTIAEKKRESLPPSGFQTNPSAPQMQKPTDLR